MTNNAAITSLALISPLGNTPQEVLENLRGQKSGITALDFAQDTKNFFAGKAAFTPPQELKHLDRAIAMGVCAGLEALDKADTAKLDPDQMGICLSVPKAGTNTMQDVWKNFSTTKTVPEDFVFNLFAATAAGIVAQKTGISGPQLSSAAACNSGISAIELAMNMLSTGKIKAVLAGCAESSLTPCVLSSYANLGVLNAKTPADFAPFDQNRCGFFTGEGAGAVVLEPLERLLEKNVDYPIAVRGTFCCSEAYHPVAPAPDAKAVIKQIRLMLETANLSPGDIDYVNLHGSATKANDRIELEILREVFGPNPKVVASSTKPYTGHLLSAAGITEIIISAIACSHKTIPANLNLKHPETQNGILPTHPLCKSVNNIMSLNFGFGSSTGGIVLSIGDSALEFAKQQNRH